MLAAVFPQECGMRMGNDWLEVSRYTSLNNSRKDNSAQTVRIEKRRYICVLLPSLCDQ